MFCLHLWTKVSFSVKNSSMEFSWCWLILAQLWLWKCFISCSIIFSIQSSGQIANWWSFEICRMYWQSKYYTSVKNSPIWSHFPMMNLFVFPKIKQILTKWKVGLAFVWRTGRDRRFGKYLQEREQRCYEVSHSAKE